MSTWSLISLLHKWFVVSFLNSIAKLCCWYYSSRPVVRSICSCYYDIWTSIMHLSIISELTCNTICIICSIHIQILFCIFLELKRMSYFWKVHIWAAVIIFKVNLKIFHFWTFMFITNILKIILFVFKVTINYFSLVLVRKRYSECKMNEYAHTHTHTHTHTGIFIIMGSFHRCNVFSTVQTVFSIPLTYKNLLHFLIFQKFNSVWFINLFPHGDQKLVRIYWYCYPCGHICCL